MSVYLHFPEVHHLFMCLLDILISPFMNFPFTASASFSLENLPLSDWNVFPNSHQTYLQERFFDISCKKYDNVCPLNFFLGNFGHKGMLAFEV